MNYKNEFKRCLPNSCVIENKDFAIYTNSELTELSESVLEHMTAKKQLLLDYFRLDGFRKIEINLFNDKKAFLEFTKQFFKPTAYCIAHFGGGMINFFIAAEKIENNHQKIIRTIAHEFVHLIYKEKVLGEGNRRVLWLDEGLAQFLSGELSELDSDEDFKQFFLNKIIGPNRLIPDIKFLTSHGSRFGKFCDLETNKYNGYNLSSVIVRYLNEIVAKEKIQAVVRNSELINELSNNILNDAVNYYCKKYKIKYNNLNEL